MASEEHLGTRNPVSSTLFRGVQQSFSAPSPRLLAPLTGDGDLDLDGYLVEDLLARPDHGQFRLLRDLRSYFLRTLDYELVMDAVYEAGVEALQLLADVDERQLGDVRACSLDGKIHRLPA